MHGGAYRHVWANRGPLNTERSTAANRAEERVSTHTPHHVDTRTHNRSTSRAQRHTTGGKYPPTEPHNAAASLLALAVCTHPGLAVR